MEDDGSNKWYFDKLRNDREAASRAFAKRARETSDGYETLRRKEERDRQGMQTSQSRSGGGFPFWRLAFMIGAPIGGALPIFGKAGMWIAASAPAWEKIGSAAGGLAIGGVAAASIFFDDQFRPNAKQVSKRPEPVASKEVDRAPVDRSDTRDDGPSRGL